MLECGSEVSFMGLAMFCCGLGKKYKVFGYGGPTLCHLAVLVACCRCISVALQKLACCFLTSLQKVL